MKIVVPLKQVKKMLSGINKKKVFDWLKAFSIAFVIVLTFRGFVLEPFTIPSPSMEKTLLAGDFILVNKLSYGPRLIRTPLSIPFVDKKWFSELFTFSYFRFFGVPDVERDDILVFNYPVEEEFPVDHRTHFIKRCVGLPGDSIGIIDGEVFINGKSLEKPEGIQYNYTVQTDASKANGKIPIDSIFLQANNITEGGLISEKGDYSFSLTKKSLANIKTLPAVKEVTMNVEKNELWDETVFPYKDAYPWNVDNFGALYIPKKGDTLILDSNSVFLYERLISVYEGNKFENIDNKFIINGDTTNKYVTKMNYYFMMGDNRHNSMDSRYWGFLPEDHIVGKAWIVFYSYDKVDERIRWERCFKKVK